MKKLVILMVSVALSIFLQYPVTHAKQINGEKRMIMTSGYYSPLPGQSFYVRGSYEADKVLNGNGTNGADGTEVYIGMLAAPKGYSFGTRVKIPGLGVGEVHDRGGAILAGRSYDRIDIWMGYGEEGLARALNWGMRLVEGEVFYNADQVEPELDFGWVSDKLPESVVNRLRAKSFLNPQTFAKPITKDSPKETISELQEALRLFGYYHGEVDGVYDEETREAVLTFQIDEGVIQDIKAQGAGNFGPKTQQALKTKTENFNSRVIKEQKRLKENLQFIESGLGKKAKGDDVYSLQQMLWELGYYKGELNGNYDPATMDAVLAFQKDHGVIKNEWEKGAGYFGKRTHEALVAAVGQRAEKIAKYPVEMQVWVPAKIELPKLADLSGGNVEQNKLDLKFGDLKYTEKTLIPLFAKSIKLKDRGDDVAKLQNILIKEGHLEAGLNTGYFGEKTKQALIQFQLINGIVKQKTDSDAGIIGLKTIEALNNLNS